MIKQLYAAHDGQQFIVHHSIKSASAECEAALEGWRNAAANAGDWKDFLGYVEKVGVYELPTGFDPEKDFIRRNQLRRLTETFEHPQYSLRPVEGVNIDEDEPQRAVMAKELEENEEIKWEIEA